MCIRDRGYIDGNEILARGELASEINFQEILITEFVFAGLLDELTVPEICAVLIGVDSVSYTHLYARFAFRTRSCPVCSSYGLLLGKGTILKA